MDINIFDDMLDVASTCSSPRRRKTTRSALKASMPTANTPTVNPKDHA